MSKPTEPAKPDGSPLRASLMVRQSLLRWRRILGASVVIVVMVGAVGFMGLLFTDWLDPFSCAVSVEPEFADEDEPPRNLWPAADPATEDLVLSRGSGTHVLRLDGSRVIAEYSTDQEVRLVGPGGGHLFALERDVAGHGLSSNVLTRDGTVVLRSSRDLSSLDEERLIGFDRDANCGHRGATVVNLSERSVERVELPELERGVAVWGRGQDGSVILCEVYEAGSGPECANGFPQPERYWRLDVHDLTVEPIDASALPVRMRALLEMLKPVLETSLPAGVNPREVIRTATGLVVDSSVNTTAGALTQGPLFFCDDDGTDCRELWLPTAHDYVSIIGLI